MSEAGLGKGFVFVLVLLFSFAFLISIIPADFIGAVDPEDMVYYDDVPEGWVGDEIAGWNEQFTAYGNVTIHKDSADHDFEVGEHNVEIGWVDWSAEEDPIYFQHEIKWFIFSAFHYFAESPVGESSVRAEIESSDPETSRFTMTCSNRAHAFTWYVSITYNATKFSSLEEAYDGNDSYDPELRVFIGQGWESEIGTVNAWNVVSQLLTFNTPETGNVYINTLVGFSLWACIIYLAYRLILIAIPTLGG